MQRAAAMVCLVVGIAAAGPVNATAFCEVASSKDGFAALRAAPDRGAKIVMKLTPAHMVQLHPVKSTPTRNKDWVAVSAIPYGQSERILARGWIHKAMIVPDSCG